MSIAYSDCFSMQYAYYWTFATLNSVCRVLNFSLCVFFIAAKYTWNAGFSARKVPEKLTTEFRPDPLGRSPSREKWEEGGEKGKKLTDRRRRGRRLTRPPAPRQVHIKCQVPPTSLTWTFDIISDGDSGCVGSWNTIFSTFSTAASRSTVDSPETAIRQMLMSYTRCIFDEWSICQ